MVHCWRAVVQRGVFALLAGELAAGIAEEARRAAVRVWDCPKCTGRANAYYFYGGETAGYNSFIGNDPANQVTLVVWTNLTVSLDEMPTANVIMLKVLGQIYVVSPPPAAPAVAP